MKRFHRILSLFLAIILLIGVLPMGIFAADSAEEPGNDVPPVTEPLATEPSAPESEPTPDTSPETASTTVPAETVPETTVETTVPETAPETVPETTTTDTEATTPATDSGSEPTVSETVPESEAEEDAEPAETEPEIVELDPTFFQSLILFSAAPRTATGTLKVDTNYSIPVANGYISAGGWHYYQMDTLKVNNVAAFCIQPGVEIPGGASGVTYTQSTSLGSYLTKDKQKAVALALYYGYPSTHYATISGGTAADPTLGGNPTYWAEAEKLTATQIIVWEICLGYRNATAPYARTSSYLYDKINGSGRNWVNFKNVYNSIASSMAKSSTIPSFSASSAGAAPVTTLQYDSASGKFTATLADTNWSLGYYSQNRNHSTGDTVEIPTGINGVTATFTWGKNVLTITATPDAAASLNGNLVTLRNNTVTDADPSRALLLWVRSGCQTVVQAASVGYSPVPAYFKLDAEILTGTAKVLKTTNTGSDTDGWKVGIYSDAACQNKVADLVTGTNNTTDLQPGTYYAKEYGDTQGRWGSALWICDTTVKQIAVKAGETATVTFSNSQLGTAKIIKTTNTGSDLAGWQFNIYSDAACTRHFAGPLTSRADGTISANLTPGTYFVRETADANHPGWSFDTAVKPVTVAAGQTASVTFRNIQEAGFTLEKSINASDSCIRQLEGNHMYTLEGAEYEVRDASGNVLETLTTDAAGKAASTGTYAVGTVLTIVETAAPAGFLLDTTPHVLTVSSNPSKNVVKVSDVPAFDPHTLQFQKIDKETVDPQGDASFEGAVFKWEYFDNPTHSGTPTRTWYFETNSRGIQGYHSDYLADPYVSDALYQGTSGKYELPIGSLRVTEVKSPAGYGTIPVLYATITQAADGSAEFNWTAESQDVVASKDGIYELEEPIVHYGSIEVQKLDADLGTTPQGDASSLKTQYNVINLSSNAVQIGSFPAAATGEVCYSFWTDDAGHFKSGSIFPVGDYKLVEAAAPEGYTLNTAWSQTFTVTDREETFSFVSPETALTNVPIHGGVQIVKENILVGSATGADADLEGITFSIRTDSANPVVVDGTTYQQGDVVAVIELAWDAGLGKWIAATAADLLPYGTYTIWENPMTDGSVLANGSYFLSDDSFTFQIRADGEIVTADTDGSDMVFTNIPVPEIGTQANIDGEKDAYAAETITLTDTVAFQDLIPGKEYTVSGVLMDKATNSPFLVNGEQVTAETTFTPEESAGTVDVEFTFDGSGIAAQTEIVVFETLYRDGVELAVHADIQDQDQTVTVHVPEIGTQANIDGEKDAYAAETITLTDTVSYTDLIPGKEYTVSGILMNKSTGEPFLVNGEQVTAETTFTPEEPSGTVDVEFTFDGSGIAAQTEIVVFETLHQDGVELAVHADIQDKDQTVTIHVPEIGTQASIDGEKDAYAAESITLTDTVAYTDLIPGKEYTVSGILMDKSTGEPFLVDGEEVTAETTFTPEEPSGTVDVEFTFDGSGIAEKTEIVVFETLHRDGVELAVHADIQDQDQTVTVHVPEIGTQASIDGEKDAYAAESITLTDTVAYTDLIPGKEYTVSGVLMDKATNSPFLVDGEEVTAETTFTPEESSGTVDVEFIFDGSGIAAKTEIVVFETLYQDGVELAVHADIQDKDQTVTVHVPEIGTQASIDGKKEITASGPVTIQDTVSYTDLIPGKEYTVSGIIMNKATGKPLVLNGKRITGETTFTPEAPDGEVTVTFTVDAKYLTRDTELVVFEGLYRDDVELAVHADIQDKGQTVTIRVPKPGKPETGDTTNLLPWISLLAISLAGITVLAVTLHAKKRKAQ